MVKELKSVLFVTGTRLIVPADVAIVYRYRSKTPSFA